MSKHQLCRFESKNRFALGATLSAIALLISLLVSQPATAQTYTVLHSFTNGRDGANPQAGLSMDRAGNLYGTAVKGGTVSCGVLFISGGCGAVFKLTHTAGGWTFSPLYQFTGHADGAPPSSGVVVGPDNALYGTAMYGGNLDCNPSWYGCGVVYKLTPPSTFCRTVSCDWTETPIFTFPNNDAGEFPAGDLAFDAQGNIYGTTESGGHINYGVVFELSRSGGTWSEDVLHVFPGNTLMRPFSGVVFDHAGNLYGTAQCNDCFSGGIFQLTPTQSGWTETDIYTFDFPNPGDAVPGGLVVDSGNNLFGGTIWGGASNFGTIYELNALPGGHWNASTLYNFVHASGGPYARLTMDSAGNLYGTAFADGAHAQGSVFKLTQSSGGWIYTDLHDFNGSDGAHPISSVLIGPDGNLYGTTSIGGDHGYGVVWEITP